MKIKTENSTTTTDPFAALYRSFAEKGLPIPAPLELMSASKPLFEVFRTYLGHYVSNPSLSPKLLACIRYAVAHRSDFDACIAFNREVLSLHGIQKELALLEKAECHAVLDDRDSRIFHLAMDAIFHPDKVTEERLAQMKHHDISEQTLFEAAYHGAMLLATGPLVRAFG
ncbi:MAG: hypothetical protein JXR76_16850 [Deltaproteobacteria bacterium]|nr:hypothetical protein [Deltaproteobacteria bacterium]